MSANRLLIMDSEPGVRGFVTEVGRDLGFEVVDIADPGQLISAIRRFSPTVVIVDLQMPDHDGIEALRALSETPSSAAVVLATGSDGQTLTRMEEHGMAMGVDIAGSFLKPIPLDQLEIQLVRLKIDEKELTAPQLAEAIENGQLVVHFQPIVTMQSAGRWIVEGAEALVRWQHDDYGLIQPDEFLGLAEMNGLMVGLTDFVFRAAMEQARVWHSNGFHMDVAINLSAQFLTDLEFPDRVMTLIRENNLAPRALTLELNETAAMENPVVAMEILARLRAQNINLSLDDFGTGFASLTQLYLMPFSELKIDTSVIMEMTANEAARAMVEGLVYLAHKLGMKACAEGVEDAATLELLEQMGCDRAQGHHIGKPVRPRELEALVKNWNGAPSRQGMSEAV